MKKLLITLTLSFIMLTSCIDVKIEKKERISSDVITYTIRKNNMTYRIYEGNFGKTAVINETLDSLQHIILKKQLENSK
jgi:hypothetical protein